jgi:nucleoid DNA-binding protein
MCPLHLPSTPDPRDQGWSAGEDTLRLAGWGISHAGTEQELTVREARAIIDAIFGSIEDALARHESVELPIGIFSVWRNPQERARRFGKVIELRKCRFYWSRRVIPVAVYASAMLQAKKTLAPQDLFFTVDGRY